MRGSGVGAVLKLAVIAFMSTLGVVAGNRMSDEALAVVIGVVCGVLAAIPVSVLILILMGRLGGQKRDDGRQPEVYIIPNPVQGLPSLSAWPGFRPALGATGTDFKVLGRGGLT